MAADGDHYILILKCPVVNVEDVYVRIESSTYQLMPGKDYIVVQGRIHRTNWHLYPYNVICRLHARVQRYASRLNKMTWGSVRV